MRFKAKKFTGEIFPEEAIRQRALQRLADVFGLPAASLTLDAQFARELKAAPASDFRTNAFDIIDGDIRDVADKRLLKDMAQGLLVIPTVGDYCEHIVRCSRMNPDEVAHILRLSARD